MALASSLREAEDKFIKEFPNKRGTSYEVTGITLYEANVIK